MGGAEGKAAGVGEVVRKLGGWAPPGPAGVGGGGYGQRSQVLQVLESQAEELGSCPRPVGSRRRVLNRGKTRSGLKVPLAAEWGRD